MALRGARDEEQEPWLASAEPDGRETYVSRKRFRLVALLLGGLLLVVAALVYAVVARPHADDGTGFVGEAPLIRAPDGPFKTRPADAGGMDVEGLNQTTYQAAGGVDPEGQLALDQIPEEPMARPVARVPQRAPVQAAPMAPPTARDLTPPEPPRVPAPREPAPKSAPLPTVKVPAATIAKPAAEKTRITETPKPSRDRLADVLDDIDTAPKASKASKPIDDDLPSVSGGGASLQLGAFSSSAKAEAAWKAMQRYGYIAGLAKSVVKIERADGETVYRLRATGVETGEKASNLCARLKVAGEQCVVSR